MVPIIVHVFMYRYAFSFFRLIATCIHPSFIKACIFAYQYTMYTPTIIDVDTLGINFCKHISNL